MPLLGEVVPDRLQYPLVGQLVLGRKLFEQLLEQLPSASVSTAVTVKTGLLRSIRSAYRRSRQTVSIKRSSPAPAPESRCRVASPRVENCSINQNAWPLGEHVPLRAQQWIPSSDSFPSAWRQCGAMRPRFEPSFALQLPSGVVLHQGFSDPHNARRAC